jgi:hypothetical protein
MSEKVYHSDETMVKKSRKKPVPKEISITWVNIIEPYC